jgi:hypothetical protein
MPQLVPTVVYVLCLITASMCAGLLIRGYRRTAQPLLFWSALCFLFLALNSLVVIVDILLVPEHDLRLMRHGLTLTAVGSLLFGLVWNER